MIEGGAYDCAGSLGKTRKPIRNRALVTRHLLIEYQLKPHSVRWAIEVHKNMYAEPDMTYILMTMVRRASRGRTAKKLIFT